MPDAPTFASLGLSTPLLDTLTLLGYEAPTPIQARTIPALLAGRDIIGQAQTGTGKTAAFALPILQQLDLSSRNTQALVLAPTRELAVQVSEAMHSYAKKLDGVSVIPVYGGAPIFGQMKHLQRGAHVVVGTPGRLIDHLDRGTLSLDHVRMVVLDEADEMLKMGFIDEVERMLSLVPKPRQVALFSATMPEPIARIAQRHLVNPQRVEIEHHTIAGPDIEQRFLNLAEGQKLEVLTQMLELEEADAVLIFRRTKNGAAELAEKLGGRGFVAEAMHGDMKQAERESVIRRLRAGKIEIVVATDVAARGLDVEQITHVINYDIPNDVEAYVHRIGRTGRAGRSGVATLFITPRERRMMREIEKFTGTQIKPMKMPSRADVAARRIAVFKESLRKELAAGDLDLYVEVVTQLAEEGPFDMADVAAAASRIAHGTRAVAAPAEAARETVASSSLSSSPSAARRADAVPESDTGDAKVRLSMALGKRDGIRPGDVVGSIANEAGIPGSDIGPIEIRDDITYVTIPASQRENVLAKLGSAKFRGKPVNLRVAGGESPSRERPRYDRERPASRDGAPSRPARPPAAGRFQRDDREERPRASKPFRPGAGATPYSDRPRAGKPFPPKKYTPSDKPYASKSKPYASKDKPYAAKGKPFAAKGKPFVSKGKPKPRKG
ncbi:MAG: ATP-dependent helicase DeaD [Thermoanaerobaculia bacterium]|jgi:ATP-dependent RNA helicase DeaD|nr:ATP-dependent helicase DeaD [Thermoanaerobaculia bacterium]